MSDQEIGMYVCAAIFTGNCIALYYLIRNIKITVTRPGKEPFKI